MNINSYLAMEEQDYIAERLEVYDSNRATWYARRQGMDESNKAAKARLKSTLEYCKSQGVLYSDILRLNRMH